MDNQLLNNGDATDCAGVKGNVKMAPLYFGGHCYYVAKQMRGEAIDGDPDRREINGIELPQSFWLHTKDKETGEITAEQQFNCNDRTQWVRVLAIGPAVGEWCNDDHAELYRRPNRIPPYVKKGDLLLCPNTDIGIKQSPLCEYEYFIEESVPRAVQHEGDKQ
jgi:hypothetical protein